MSFLHRDIHDDEIEDDIREAFRCFDKDGHGFIPISGILFFSGIISLLKFLEVNKTWDFPACESFYKV